MALVVVAGGPKRPRVEAVEVGPLRVSKEVSILDLFMID